MRSSRAWLAPALVAALALVVRLWRVNESLWADEIFTLRMAQMPLWEILIYPEQTPPLHHVFLHGWIQAAGTSEWALRLPSVLAGSAAAGLAVVVARRWLDSWGAIVAGLLVATHPALVLMGQEARAYAFVALFGTLSWWLWLKLTDGARWPVLAAYVAATAALLYTHTFGLFFVAGQAVMWILVRPPGLPFARAALAQGVALLFFAPWLGILLDRTSYVARDFWIGHPVLNDLTLTMSAMAGATLLLTLHAGLWGVAALAGTRAVQPAFVKAAAAWSTAPVVIPMAISFLIPIYRPRYAVPAATGYLILAAWAMQGLRPDWQKVAAGGILAVSLVLSLHLLPAFDAGSVRTDWRSGAGYVDEHAAANAKVLFWPGFCDSQSEVELSCAWGVYGSRTDLDLIPFGRSNVGLKDGTFEGVAARLGDADEAWLMEVRNAPTGEPVRIWMAGQFRSYESLDFDGLRVYLYSERIAA